MAIDGHLRRVKRAMGLFRDSPCRSIPLAFGVLLAFGLLWKALSARPRTVLERPVDYWISQLELPVGQRDSSTTAAFLTQPDAFLPALERRIAASEGPLRRGLRAAQKQFPLLPVRVADLDRARGAAAEMVATLGPPAATAAPALAQGLIHARGEATMAILQESLAAQGAAAVKPAIELLRARDPQVRLRATGAVMHMARSEGLSREFRRALAIALIPRLSDEDPLVIAGATECVNALGRDGALALSRLRENVKSDRAEIRHASLRAIGALARDPARSVPVLTRALDHPDGETRVLAALALAQFGPDAAPASRRLADLAESGETRTALAAIQCLGRIGAPAGEGVVEPLGRALAKHPESLVRGASAVALGRIGLGAATAVPALAEALRDEESYVRGNAAQALARFGEEADAAVPDLVRALRDPVESIRVLAVEAIGEIGAPAAAAIPHLAVARDNNPSVMNGPVRAALNRIRRDGADGL